MQKNDQGIWTRKTSPPTPYVEKVSTLYQNFNEGAKISRHSNCLGYRELGSCGEYSEYKWYSYEQVSDFRTQLGSFLVQNSSPKAKIGIFSMNSPEWIITQEACNAYSLILVPLYDSLGEDAVKFILHHAEVQITVCSQEKLLCLLKFAPQCPLLKCIVVVPSRAPAANEEINYAKAWAAQLGIRLLAWNEALSFGEQQTIPHRPPEPEEIASICYTSGTTGRPKGAILTHRNLSAPSNGLRSSGIVIFPEDVHISYLPLAHVYERATVVCLLNQGASIGFYHGSNVDLIEDIQILKPTIFSSVPRLFTKIYQKIIKNTVNASGIKGFLSRKAFEAKFKRLPNVSHAFWDRLVCNKIKAILGGRVRNMISGSAPIDEKVLTFLRVAFGCYIWEGYGLTETVCFGALTFIGDFSTGHLGGPTVGCELKFESVPEMGYFSIKDEGEICLRGPFLFKGYYKEPNLTAEAVDAQGWFHTGDIGRVDDKGKLKIIDRKKNIFKLSQGEYVAPEKLENIYTANSLLIDQIFIHGDSLQPYLVAIVVLDPEMPLEERKKVNNQQVLQELERIALQQRLQGYERVRKVWIEDSPFSVDNGLLTPTFKVKRVEALRTYKNQIQQLYLTALNNNGNKQANL
jgi:long-chain acyl-CoA synthetase